MGLFSRALLGHSCQAPKPEAEWTFPPEFAELVWSDGSKVERQMIDLKGMGPFGSRKFRLPFDTTGKKWVRFAVWDSAGNGAFTQPVHLK